MATATKPKAVKKPKTSTKDKGKKKGVKK